MSNPILTGRDLVNLTVPAPAAAYTATVAGGAGDNTAITGLTINRFSLTPYGAASSLLNVVPLGVIFLVFYEAVLQAAQTLTLKNALVQDSADGNTWATIFDQTGATAETPVQWPAAGIVDTGPTGGGTVRGCVAFGSSIKKARQYIRFIFTPDLSAANTDTAKLTVTALLSGIDEVPPGVV